MLPTVVGQDERQDVRVRGIFPTIVCQDQWQSFGLRGVLAAVEIPTDRGLGWGQIPTVVGKRRDRYEQQDDSYACGASAHGTLLSLCAWLGIAVVRWGCRAGCGESHMAKTSFPPRGNAADWCGVDSRATRAPIRDRASLSAGEVTQ
jgi:hypothetical protein